jgi:hypothetical protein
MSARSISPNLAEAFLQAIEQFKKWSDDKVDEPAVIQPSGLVDPISVFCRMVERFDDEMPEQVLRVVRPFWDEVNFGEPTVDRSYANGARLLHNRTEMRRAVYRAQREAKQRRAANPR